MEVSRKRISQQDEAAVPSPEESVGMEPAAAGQELPQSSWQQILTNDYVNALVLSRTGEAMIVEKPRGDQKALGWHVVGGYIEAGEDPMAAVQRALRQETGYGSDEWLYMGSYSLADVDRPGSTGHFFCARAAEQLSPPRHSGCDVPNIKWVSQKDLKHALLDGRIAVMSYAVTVSMALLTVLD